MSTSHKPFREILKPGTSFEFVGKNRRWALVSVALIIASIAMLFVNRSVRGDYLNWNIDFKGGTELTFEFLKDGKATTVDPADIRSALNNGGFSGFEVSDVEWNDADEINHTGIMVRTPQFGIINKTKAKEVSSAFIKEFPGVVVARWRGDDLFVRSSTPLNEAAVSAFLTKYEMEMKPWHNDTVEITDGEIKTKVAVWGLDRQMMGLFKKQIPGVEPKLEASFGISAKAGERLQRDGLRALFYAILLIMLYLAFRFDVRYAPGAVVALFHDAILVVGVFALAWQPVSLTTLAALLTVIGYSVNDTVVIFDRIRENVDKLKDKRLARVINISLNETLSRTLLTSLTLFVVTLMMNILGTGLVRNFAFAMNIGVIVGVYSSIFVAAPVLLWIDDKYYSGKSRRRRAKAE